MISLEYEFFALCAFARGLLAGRVRKSVIFRAKGKGSVKSPFEEGE